MTLRIVPPTEPIVTTSLVITLFGQPGIGKSTLAYSASRPLLLDFDGGAQRAAGRKDTVRVSAWADVAEIAAADVAQYDTIIVDTVGRALEFLSVTLMDGEPKYRRRTGELTQQGYGALKMAFAQWLSRIRTFGKHVVLIAHEKEEKDGENTIIRVDAMGATRVEVIRLSDLVGFVSASGNKRTLDFNPTEKHTGKNCAGFDALNIADVKLEPEWFAGIIKDALTRLNERTEAQREKEAETAQWLDVIGKLDTAEAINRSITQLPDDKIIKVALARRAKSLGFAWNEKDAKFVAREVENAAA